MAGLRGVFKLSSKGIKCRHARVFPPSHSPKRQKFVTRFFSQGPLLKYPRLAEFARGGTLQSYQFKDQQVGRIWGRRQLHTTASALQIPQLNIDERSPPPPPEKSSPLYERTPPDRSSELYKQDFSRPPVYPHHTDAHSPTMQDLPPVSQNQADVPTSSTPQHEPLRVPGHYPPSNERGIIPGIIARRIQISPSKTLSRKELQDKMVDRMTDRKFKELQQLFKEWKECKDPETGELNKPNLSLYNIVLLAQMHDDESIDVLMDVLQEMKECGVQPNRNTFAILFQVAQKNQDLRTLDFLFAKAAELGIPVDAEWCNAALQVCAEGREIGAAMKFVQIMIERDYKPTVDAMSSLIISCIRSKGMSQAVVLINWCKRKGIILSRFALGEFVSGCIEEEKPQAALVALEMLYDKDQDRPMLNPSVDEGTMIGVLGLAARNGDLALSMKAWDILCRSLNNTKAPSPFSFLARVHAYVAAADLNMALIALGDMEAVYAESGNSEMFSPFSSLRPFVLGCSRGGFNSLDAVYLKLEEMCINHFVPLSAINCIILGCSNIWDIDRAYQTFEAIGSVFNLRPNVHSCNALLDGFGKMRKISEAVKVFDYIVASGLQPDWRSYRLLINAHIVNRDTKSAIEAIDQMLKANYPLDKETAVKLRRRCVREYDIDGAKWIHQLSRKLNFSSGLSNDNRRDSLFRPF